MDIDAKRTGAATPPGTRYDRASTARRLRGLTVAAAIAGAAGVAGFGYVAAAGGGAPATTPTTTAAPATTATQSTTRSGSSLQAAPGAVTSTRGAGQVTSGGS